MKRITTQLLIVLVIAFGLVGMAFAGILDKVNDVIVKQDYKVGSIYDLNDATWHTVSGLAILKDINGIKGLDIDTLYDPENTLFGNVSYNYKLTDNFKVGAGLAIGLSRIENIKDAGEGHIGITILADIKF